MNQGDKIRALHVGQVVILATVAGAVALLLLSAREDAVKEKRGHAFWASQIETRTDSLYGPGYLPRRLRRLESPTRDTSNPFIRLRDSIDERHDSASLGLVLWYTHEVAGRDNANVDVILLDLALLAVSGPFLAVLWVWFGGRDHRAPPRTDARASA